MCYIIQILCSILSSQFPASEFHNHCVQGSDHRSGKGGRTWCHKNCWQPGQHRKRQCIIWTELNRHSHRLSSQPLLSCCHQEWPWVLVMLPPPRQNQWTQLEVMTQWVKTYLYKKLAILNENTFQCKTHQMLWTDAYVVWYCTQNAMGCWSVKRLDVRLNGWVSVLHKLITTTH